VPRLPRTSARILPRQDADSSLLTVLDVDQRLAEFFPFLVSLALGALVGIERERSQVEGPSSFPGGIRTFPLVALLGCAAGWLGARVGPAAFIAVAGGFFLLVVASYVVTSLKGASGITTALASLLTFLFGVMAHEDRALLAAALAVGMTALLSLRRPLHELTSKIAQDDLYAALKLAALTVIVLPVLPDRTFGPEPLDALNPFRIWLLVVLVAAMGFLGYVGVKVLGPGRGTVAAGLLGGLVSSTATTWSLSGRSRERPDLSRPLVLGIALAWSTMCVRMFLEIAFVNAPLLAQATPMLLGTMLGGIAGAGTVYFGVQHLPGQHDIPYKNPFSVWSAVRFGAFFALILLVANLAQRRFQEAGVLVAAGASGTIEVDAMTLTLARLAGTHEVSAELAVIGIAIAIASNTIVKTALAVALGARVLWRDLLPTVFGTFAGGTAGLYVALRWM